MSSDVSFPRDNERRGGDVAAYQSDEFVKRAAPDLGAGELLLIRARIYRVAGFNAYGQAMLEQVGYPTDGERDRATEVQGVR